MSNSGAATVAAAEDEEVKGKAEMGFPAAAVPEGTAKCTRKKKKKKRKHEVVNAKENGTVEHEAAPFMAAVLALEGTPKSKKKKEAKAKERVMSGQEAATTAVSALNETPKCKKKRIEKAQESGIVVQETITSAVSATEGTPKCKEEKKVKEAGIAEQETTTTTFSASEGTIRRKRRKLREKNKMQEQQKSALALSVLVAVENGEEASADADVSMDTINVEDPNCSKAKDANDMVKCKAQEGNNNCPEKFSSLQESSEGRKRKKKRAQRKRKRDVSSRGPDITSQDGGRVAKRCLDSSMDHDLSGIRTSCLVLAHKENVKNIYSPRGSLIRFQRKKLLILDLNGLLADINMDKQNAHMAHAKVKDKLVFKRPYYDDFLSFCFQNFEVGIWSSRKMENVNSVVDILMQDLKQYLLFCWDMSKCTFTGSKVIGDKHKPLVLKELKKLWNKEDPSLPWEQGEFSPSNTLLVDDSPYKALCNPPHTAIFPQPYSYLNQRDDSSLRPGGDLRAYLERLAAADDVQEFVQDNPFGQPSITKSDPKWNFYAKIVDKVERSLSFLNWNHRTKKAA